MNLKVHIKNLMPAIRLETKIIGLFALIFCFFFYFTDGTVYVFDNNETFSSLWHAYNLLNIDFNKHYGLADETFSTLVESHSFVHTHQGNFPRLFAVLLYFLGFTKANEQILLTFLIVGIPSFFCLYKVLLSTSNSKFFSVIGIIFLFTNFILFFQWLFVTYRIWYFYFIFSSFYFLINFEKKFYKWLLFLNLFFLFYFELIFAIYLSIALTIFLFISQNFKIKKIISNYYFLLFAPILSILVLLLQLYFLYGFDNLIKDITYTFTSRNFSTDSILKILEFYSSNNIVFWHNFKVFDSPGLFSLFFYNDIKYYGFFIVALLFYSISIPLFKNGANTLLSKTTSYDSFYSYINRFVFLFSNKTNFFIASFILIFINNYFIFNFISFENNLTFFEKISRPIFSICLFLYFYIFFTKRNYKLLAYHTFFTICSFTLSLLRENFQFDHIFYHYDNFYNYYFFAILINIFLIIITLDIKFIKNDLNIKGIFNFTISFFLAYLFIFYFSPGYLWSGYESRAAPLLIFLKVFIYSFSFYYIFLYLRDVFVSRIFIHKYLSISFLASILFYWFYLQFISISIYGLNNYTFLQKIENKLFYQASFLTNIYPASVSFVTKGWAFQDDNLIESKVKQYDDKLYLSIDKKYLWFADSENDIYKRPDYILCFSINGNKCNNFVLLDENYSNFIELKDYNKMQNGDYIWLLIKPDYNSNFGGLIYE